MYLKVLKIVIFCGLLVSICLFNGCSSLLLSKSQLDNLTYPQSEEHVVIYHSRHDLNTADGKLYSTTHRVVQVGNNSKSAPDYFAVSDGSTKRLTDFEARLIKKDGSETTFGSGDLSTVKSSNSFEISEVDIKILPISEVIETGDLIEMVYKHEKFLPAAGLRFSPSHIGNHGLNIEYLIEIQKNDSLVYKVINDNISPVIIKKENTKIYKFEWKEYSKKRKKSIFKNKNSAPLIFATIPWYYNSNSQSIKSIKNWVDFGDWYFELIKPKLRATKKIKDIAKQITLEETTPKEKMDAIFQYCQKNVRYEQVYLELGEIIPNKCDIVLKRKYGDCKDYSTLIFAMAKSVGLDPHYAICYRGRGLNFYQEIPVFQFNHVIIHFEDKGKHYWYDGTNRTGFPGITTLDLINQYALIIDPDNSHFVKIDECKKNLLRIEGKLKNQKSDLVGKLDISLEYQYAIMFHFADFFLNNVKMQNVLIDWVKSNLNNSLLIKKLSWEKNSNDFKITLDCEFPNSVVELNNKKYLSFNRCFPDLFSQESLPNNSDNLFYFDGYNRVKLKLDFENLVSLQNDKNIMELEYQLDPGPFSDEDKSKFKKDYINLSKESKKKYTYRKDHNL